MHTLLGLSSLLPVLVGSLVLFAILPRLTGWARRRDLQLLLLAAPIASLGLSLSELYHLVSRICFVHTPPWDYALSMALPLAMGLVALGGVGLGVVRLTLIARMVNCGSTPLEPALQALNADLSQRLGLDPPQLRLYAYDRPLALTLGLWRPTILLSTWMVDRLDRRELEAVLAHELGHVARRDYLIVWLATMLRDAFCYLPTSWVAYRQLRYEKELACDDLVIGLTKRPLALASALAKTWHYAVSGPSLGLAQLLTGESELLEGRIERLLATPKPLTSTLRSRLVAFSVGTLGLSVLVLVTALNVRVILAQMECGPVVLLERLFI